MCGSFCLGQWEVFTSLWGIWEDLPGGLIASVDFLIFFIFSPIAMLVTVSDNKMCPVGWGQMYYFVAFDRFSLIISISYCSWRITFETRSLLHFLYPFVEVGLCIADPFQQILQN